MVMRLFRQLTWPRRRLRCARVGHKWTTVTTGGEMIDLCVRCGKRQAAL